MAPVVLAAFHLLLAPAFTADCISPAAAVDMTGEEYSGGATTVFDSTRNAFSLPLHNLSEERRATFFVGNSFFNENWVAAKASTTGRDGLGPLFNARSCSACHFKDGRGRPPEPGVPMQTMILRVSIPGNDRQHGPKPHPIYGGQLQTNGTPGAVPECEIRVDYDEIPGTYADGETYSLRRPRYTVSKTAHGELPPDLQWSARVAPAMIGLGLLEAIPGNVVLSHADPDDADRDGISGRVNRVPDLRRGGMVVGRFGWKAEQPTVLQQTAGAFNEDMGLTSSLVPSGSHATLPPKSGVSNSAEPEVKEATLDAVALYSRALAVPARRNWNSPEVSHGRSLFTQLQCAACHMPELRTGASADLPEVASQTIHPFTDLLLHDMGEGLSDDRPSFEATGREWRTPPLWGAGLVRKVNGHTQFLHDGRARNFSEAVLWHGGEAERAREQFRNLRREDRQALLAFLESL